MVIGLVECPTSHARVIPMSPDNRCPSCQQLIPATGLDVTSDQSPGKDARTPAAANNQETRRSALDVSRMAFVPRQLEPIESTRARSYFSGLGVAKDILTIVVGMFLGIVLVAAFGKLDKGGFLLLILYLLIAPIIINPGIVYFSLWLPTLMLLGWGPLGWVPAAIFLAIFGLPIHRILWGYRNSARYKLGIGPRPE